MAENTSVAARIGELRASRNLTLEQLSERCGLSPEQISAIEGGDVLPSLTPLLQLARGLGVRLGTLLDDAASLGPVVSRAGAAPETVRFSGGARSGGLAFHALAANKQDRHMEPFLIDVQPAAPGEHKLSSHEGEEFLFVLDGALEIEYGKATHTLEAGDSIYYDSIVPHQVRSAGDGPARILAVVYAPA